MNICHLLLSLLLLIGFPCQAAIYIPREAFPKPRVMPEPKLSLQVIQAEFLLNSNTIQKATLKKDARGQYRGLYLELEAEPAAQLEKMTREGMGKPMNLVFDGKIFHTMIIQTAISKRFLLVSLPKEQAQAFINFLQYKKMSLHRNSL